MFVYCDTNQVTVANSPRGLMLTFNKHWTNFGDANRRNLDTRNTIFCPRQVSQIGVPLCFLAGVLPPKSRAIWCPQSVSHLGFPFCVPFNVPLSVLFSVSSEVSFLCLIFVSQFCVSILGLILGSHLGIPCCISFSDAFSATFEPRFSVSFAVLFSVSFCSIHFVNAPWRCPPSSVPFRVLYEVSKILSFYIQPKSLTQQPITRKN